MSRKTFLVAAVVLAAMLAIPLAAHAQPNGHELSLRLEPPVNFEPTADCPTSAAIYRVALHGETGSGTNCILADVARECPADVTAQFCQDVPVRMTVSFKGGRIDADVTIFEAWNCDDAVCSVDQRWSGTVTGATRRFHAFEGGSVSGGGLFAFDLATFDVTLDEVLSITPAD
jgi:hypothetical protein